MKSLTTQLTFNAKRLFIRNYGFLFFTILMPIAFYILFTKVLVSGSAAEMHQFAKQYLGNMIVYSVLINALFGLGEIMQNDRHQGLLLQLSLTPKGTKPYYGAIAILETAVNLISILLLEVVAQVTQQLNLSLEINLGIALICILGTLPIMGLGVASSFAKTPQMANVISNITVFPLSILSGLWWPITLFPHWAQVIGKATPTYLTSHLINLEIQQQALPFRDMIGLTVWLVIIAAFVLMIIKFVHRKDVRSAQQIS